MLGGSPVWVHHPPASYTFTCRQAPFDACCGVHPLRTQRGVALYRTALDARKGMGGGGGGLRPRWKGRR